MLETVNVTPTLITESETLSQTADTQRRASLLISEINNFPPRTGRIRTLAPEISRTFYAELEESGANERDTTKGIYALMHKVHGGTHLPMRLDKEGQNSEYWLTITDDCYSESIPIYRSMLK